MFTEHRTKIEFNYDKIYFYREAINVRRLYIILKCMLNAYLLFYMWSRFWGFSLSFKTIYINFIPIIFFFLKFYLDIF